MGSHGIVPELHRLQVLVDTSDGAVLDGRVDTLETTVAAIPADIDAGLDTIKIGVSKPSTAAITDAPTKAVIDAILADLQTAGIYS